MSQRILERRGNQVWVEYEDYDGNIVQEWQHDPVRMCACGKTTADSCSLVRETTFTETYRCGYVYHYNNTHGYDDNLISVNGKRVK